MEQGIQYAPRPSENMEMKEFSGIFESIPHLLIMLYIPISCELKKKRQSQDCTTDPLLQINSH